MGKHDMATETLMNEALEKHYQQRIAELEKAVAEKDRALRLANTTLERADIRLQAKDAYIDELRSALVEMTVKATVAGGTK